MEPPDETYENPWVARAESASDTFWITWGLVGLFTLLNAIGAINGDHWLWIPIRIALLVVWLGSLIAWGVCVERRGKAARAAGSRP